ncbi:PC-esterase domain-containing protein 1A-like isoform X3 [Thunnus thynnus]|uniref:PC-esterase domain-containing protein 1A-like isoform X3 n=1 Tax=Thunnus thynnus TaxID=8237 RepID=UPI00352785F4
MKALFGELSANVTLATDCCAAMRTFVTRSQARQLLHNKFVVVLGGSVQRSMYKDLVLLLQRDQYLTLPQLKSKGELSFERDSLVEGGRLGPMTNGTEYREVRQYRSDHHLLRFYFLTRIYSPYVESVLEDFQQGLKPDVIVISSCVWDITRYGLECFQQYKENLHKFFGQIKTIVCHECLILWTLAMPLGKKIKGGFLVPEISHLGPTVCYDIIEANLYSGRLADAYGLDILDLHFHFRLNLQNRMPDGVHWDALAHRRISSLLLQHAADAWGVQLPHPPFPPGQVCQGYRRDFGHHSFRPEWPHPRPPLDSGALQRQTLVQYEQNHLRSHNFHFAPPNTEQQTSDPCWRQHSMPITTTLHRLMVTTIELSTPTVSRTLLVLGSVTFTLHPPCTLILLHVEVSLLQETGLTLDSIITLCPPPTCGGVSKFIIRPEPSAHRHTPGSVQVEVSVFVLHFKQMIAV